MPDSRHTRLGRHDPVRPVQWDDRVHALPGPVNDTQMQLTSFSSLSRLGCRLRGLLRHLYFEGFQPSTYAPRTHPVRAADAHGYVVWQLTTGTDACAQQIATADLTGPAAFRKVPDRSKADPAQSLSAWPSMRKSKGKLQHRCRALRCRREQGHAALPPMRSATTSGAASCSRWSLQHA